MSHEYVDMSLPTGVVQSSKNRFYAWISQRNKRIRIGNFDTLDEALAARKAAEIRTGYAPGKKPNAGKAARTCSECEETKRGTRVFPHIDRRLCKECYEEHKRQAASKRSAKRRRLLNRPCKQCGKPINSTDPNKVVCGTDCQWASYVKEPVQVSCANCGQPAGERMPGYAKKYSRFYCDLEDCRLAQRKASGLATWANRPRKPKPLPILYLCICGKRLKIDGACKECRGASKRLKPIKPCVVCGKAMLSSRANRTRCEDCKTQSNKRMIRGRSSEQRMAELRRELIRLHGPACVFCGRKDRPTLEHLIAVKHAPELMENRPNLAIACLWCNSQKQDKTPLDYVVWAIRDGNGYAGSLGRFSF